MRVKQRPVHWWRVTGPIRSSLLLSLPSYLSSFPALGPHTRLPLPSSEHQMWARSGWGVRESTGRERRWWRERHYWLLSMLPSLLPVPAEIVEKKQKVRCPLLLTFKTPGPTSGSPLAVLSQAWAEPAAQSSHRWGRGRRPPTAKWHTAPSGPLWNYRILSLRTSWVLVIQGQRKVSKKVLSIHWVQKTVVFLGHRVRVGNHWLRNFGTGAPAGR